MKFNINTIIAESWAKATDNVKPIEVKKGKSTQEIVLLLSRQMMATTTLSAEERNEVIEALLLPDIQKDIVQRAANKLKD